MLSRGSPIPINTRLVSLSRSGIDSIWLIISVAVRWWRKPMRPVAQNLQPILQPACDDTHSVMRSPSGISADSIYSPSEVRNKYFFVPSCDTDSFSGALKPNSQCSLSISRATFDRSVIESMSETKREYSHLAICLCAKRGKPSSSQRAFSWAKDAPYSLNFEIAILQITAFIDYKINKNKIFFSQK